MERGSVRGAADHLNTAPSVISRQLQLLEYEIGAVLFDRRHNGVVATEAAQKLLEYTRGLQINLEHFRESLYGELRGHVDIALTEGYVGKLMDSVISDFLHRHPHVTIEMNVRTASGVESDISKKHVHIGLTYDPSVTPDIRVCVRVVHPVILVVSRGHPLVGAAPIDLADVARYPVALPSPQSGIGRLVLRVAQVEDVRLVPRLVTNSAFATLLFAHTGGVAFATDLLLEAHARRDEFVALPLRNPLFNTRDGAVLVNRERPLSRAATEVLKRIESDLLTMHG